MSKDITTAGPSRRQIAKGAAWAVPAVTVAALAASPNYCETPTVTVEGVCPPLIGADTRSVYFRVTNTGDCIIRSGLAFNLTQTGLVGLTVDHLTTIQVDAAVIFDSPTAGIIQRDIPAGGLWRSSSSPMSSWTPT